MKDEKVIREFVWYTMQPKGANQFHGSIIEWNKTLIQLLYKADAELLKDVVKKLGGYFEIKSTLKRKLYVSTALIDLIFIPEIYDALIERFDLIVDTDITGDNFTLRTGLIEGYEGMVIINVKKENSPQIKHN